MESIGGETGALREHLAARGLSFSEARCFGLGRGLSFSLTVNPAPPSRSFSGLRPGLHERIGRDDGPEAMSRAVVECGAHMLDVGVPALRHFVADLPAWPALPDFRSVSQQGFAAIQHGTGGGLFRALFAQFLDEVGQPVLKRVAHRYRELAWGWGELATAMHLASRDGAWDGLPEHAAHLADLEEELASLLVKRA